MIQLLGIKKNIGIEIRERLSLHPKKQDIYRGELLKIFKEVVIISTCNRTEIYFNGSLSKEEGLKKIFEVLNWDIELIESCFYLEEEETIKHLMEVVCGFHSRILGEDQILGQIKYAYQQALKSNSVKSELQRLFQEAISCGKKFRTEGKLYEIPVSSASIAANAAIKSGAKKIMLIGYGDVGKLVYKYCYTNEIEELIIVVRDINKLKYLNDNKIKVMNYEDGRNVINDMDAVISCTSAPHLIIEKKHISKEGKPIKMFDLAVPRDIDVEIGTIDRITLLDIDDISVLDDKNKSLRIKRMQDFKYIPDKYKSEFITWKKLRGLSDNIQELKRAGSKVVDERCKKFSDKCKNPDDIDLAKILIKSTSDAYINKAIEVLKEEKLKGCEDECIRMLQKIFQINQ
ncbi:glutamyl-tRNA reductase [Clostridium carnis]